MHGSVLSQFGAVRYAMLDGLLPIANTCLGPGATATRCLRTVLIVFPARLLPRTKHQPDGWPCMTSAAHGSIWHCGGPSEVSTSCARADVPLRSCADRHPRRLRCFRVSGGCGRLDSLGEKPAPPIHLATPRTIRRRRTRTLPSPADGAGRGSLRSFRCRDNAAGLQARRWLQPSSEPPLVG
jgi:hypothetical protein